MHEVKIESGDTAQLTCGDRRQPVGHEGVEDQRMRDPSEESSVLPRQPPKQCGGAADRSRRPGRPGGPR